MKKIRLNYPVLYFLFFLIIFILVGEQSLVFYGLFIVAVALEHISDSIREK
jgi:hypothetical protein